MEWNGFALTEDEGHLALGWDTALQALDRTAWDDARLAALSAHHGASLLPAADPYFRADTLDGGSAFDPGFAILVGTHGAGALATEHGGEDLPFTRGSAVLVPYAAGAGELRGDVRAIRARPADPSAPEPHE